MWFKQLSVYITDTDNIPDVTDVSEQLERARFMPVMGLDWFAEGFAPILKTSEALVSSVNNTYRFSLKKEERVLPSAVIRDLLDEKINEIQETESRQVGRKEKQELKDNITDDLLPRAFTKSNRTEALWALDQGYLFVNQATANRAENCVSKLRDALGSLNAKLPNTVDAVSGLMTIWLHEGHAQGGFDLDSDCELKGTGDVAPTVRISKQDLTADEVRKHLEYGKTVTQLGLIWQDKVRFVLTQDLTFKRIQFLDVLQEEAADAGEDLETLALATQILMADTFSTMVSELISHLSGLTHR